MRAKGINRYSHAGKNSYEKEAYKNFLNSKLYLDKTEKDPTDINKTSESSFEEEKIKPSRVRKKSSFLRAKDFIYDNWVIAILAGLILFVVDGYITIYRDQGIQIEKIANIEKDIDSLDKNNKNNNTDYNSLKDNFNTFKAEVSKDLEYIKKKIKL